MAITVSDMQERCKRSCWEYAQWVLPHYAFGSVHKEIFMKMGHKDRLTDDPNLLFLIPRDHLKSVCLAVYATWRVANDPCYTILYITADEDLGKLQMAFMQSIFESDQFRALYPDHFIPESGRREKWTTAAVNTDHPLRKARNLRDDTIAVKTIKAGKTGRHPDEIMYDDLVVPENAYTALGRSEVNRGAAQAVSIAKSNSLMTAVGTRYHPIDQYATWAESTYPRYNDVGEIIGEFPLWSIYEKKVEDIGDGTGAYLWPRTYSTETGHWYGWDIQSIAKKKAEYLANGEIAQFYAQYYMEPNDPTSERVSRDKFMTINPRKLLKGPDGWEYSGKKLNIVAAMDVAITDSAAKNAKKADFTAIAVVGQCTEGFYYILALSLFKTDKRGVYAKELIDLWKVWNFRRVFVELESAGKIVAEGLKETMREEGYSLIIDGQTAPRGISKQERHASITLPKYESQLVYHQEGGYYPMLEEQLIQVRPSHDDALDAVTIGIENVTKPQSKGFRQRAAGNDNVVRAHNRFGGRLSR